MAGSLALSGLASGIDTSAIIQQLMALESQGKTRLTTKQSQSQAREAGIKDVQAKLTALKTAADALGTASTWKSAQTADSSDATRVGATLLGGTAGAGGTTISVTALAAAAQHAYEYDSAAGADDHASRRRQAADDRGGHLDPGCSGQDQRRRRRRLGDRRPRRRAQPGRPLLRREDDRPRERVLHRRPDRQPRARAGRAPERTRPTSSTAIRRIPTPPRPTSWRTPSPASASR